MELFVPLYLVVCMFTPSGLRLAPPSAREEAQKERHTQERKKQPANKNRPGVKGPACGCQQAKAKQQAFLSISKVPLLYKKNWQFLY